MAPGRILTSWSCRAVARQVLCRPAPLVCYVFARASDCDLTPGHVLHLAGCPEVRDFFDETSAREVLGRLRGRAVALQIAALYPEDTPSKVESRLVAKGLMHARNEDRRLARMIRTGMPMVPVFDVAPPASANEPLAMNSFVDRLPDKVRYAYGRVISKHPQFLSLLNDSIWRLLDPRPISAGFISDLAADAVTQGVPPWWLCRADSTMDEELRYRLLLHIALFPSLGPLLALRCALIEMRYAEAIGDLPRYETCLRAIPDIVSTSVPDNVLLLALTGVPCEGTRRGRSGPWLLADGQQANIMHLSTYVVAAFSRVVLARRALEYPRAVDRYLRARGLELDGLPRFAGLSGPTSASGLGAPIPRKALCERTMGLDSACGDDLCAERLGRRDPQPFPLPDIPPTLRDVPTWRDLRR